MGGHGGSGGSSGLGGSDGSGRLGGWGGSGGSSDLGLEFRWGVCGFVLFGIYFKSIFRLSFGLFSVGVLMKSESSLLFRAPFGSDSLVRL